MAKLIKRYKRGEYELYDDKFDHLSTESEVLNSGNHYWGISSIIWEKKNIENEIYLLTGDKAGNVVNAYKETLRATIPSLKDQLKDIEKRFEALQEERTVRGFAKLADYPSDLLKEKLELEAKLDVALSEKAYLQERLEKGKEQEEVQRTDDMLKYGLRQQVQLRDGKIDTIDGQKVTYIDGAPVISDKESQYYGMSVVDYRNLANKWIADRRKNDADKFKKICDALKEKGLPVPTQPKVSSIKSVDKNSLPAYPEGVKKYL